MEIVQNTDFLTEIQVEIDPYAIRGDDGKSPYVDEEGWWWEFDDQTREYKKTDVRSDRDAAEKAHAAAEEAKSAASQATTAAEQASTAAGSANDAAGKAESAANAANEAASAAGAAAGKAETAADNAKTLSDKFSEVEFTVEQLPADHEPTADIEQTETKTSFHLGVPTSNLAYSSFYVDDEMNLVMVSPETLEEVTFRMNEQAELEVCIG